jgi:hypothetical protein
MGWASHLDGMYLGQDEAPQTAAEAAPESANELMSPNGNEVTSQVVSLPEARILGMPLKTWLAFAAAATITYIIMQKLQSGKKR